METEVSFPSGEITVHGTVISPAGPGGERPGIVLVPGAGEGVPRESYRPHAEAFARAGITALIYDKRGPEEGYSLYEASFTDLASDAIAGVEVLRDRPDVDPDLVGVHGHSEGGWTVTVAGNASPDVAFVVASAPSALPPERTQIWMNTIQLRHAGVKDPLLRPLGENLTRHIVAADMFRLAGHDPVPPLQRLEQPVLGLFAEHDRSTPPAESLHLYQKALDHGGNPHYTLRVIPGAHHEMVPSADGFDRDLTDLGGFTDLSPEYVEITTAWVHALTEDPPRTHADTLPEQAHKSTSPVPLAWYESAGLPLLASAVLLLVFVGHPVAAAVRRLRGRHGPLPTHWPARVLAVLGLTAVPLTFGYLVHLMLVGATDLLGPVVAGRPLPWLLLQAAAMGAVAATAALGVQGWRHRGELDGRSAVRLGVLFFGGLLLVPWAVYWGLFTW